MRWPVCKHDRRRVQASLKGFAVSAVSGIGRGRGMTRAPSRNDISADFVRSFLDYDPETGIFTRPLSAPRLAGTRAGWQDRTGYRKISVARKEYLEHRVAWLLTHGSWPEELDHINGDPADNRICNLRLATRSQNCANRRVTKRSKSGIKGISQKSSGTWEARIALAGRGFYLGTFPTADAALAAYTQAAQKYHGEFAVLNFRAVA